MEVSLFGVFGLNLNKTQTQDIFESKPQNWINLENLLKSRYPVATR